MIKTLITIMILSLTMVFIGCEEKNDVLVIDETPAAPQNVFSITGDSQVFLYWNGPYEADIDEYIIWRSYDPVNNYVEVGSVNAVPNPDLDLLIYEYVDFSVVNGQTYYYAVSTVDLAGQVSDLSAENVFDTPRPEGADEMFDSTFAPSNSAFIFSAGSVVPVSSPLADVFVDEVGGVFYINAVDDLTDIQDMGYTSPDFSDISWAPSDGWSDNGWLEIIEGHTYVVWTRDGHFAKIRTYQLNSNSVLFTWAYQTDFDNPELVAPALTSKPSHKPGYLNKSAVLTIER
jgi:hypothetical protein